MKLIHLCEGLIKVPKGIHSTINKRAYHALTWYAKHIQDGGIKIPPNIEGNKSLIDELASEANGESPFADNGNGGDIYFSIPLGNQYGKEPKKKKLNVRITVELVLDANTAGTYNPLHNTITLSLRNRLHNITFRKSKEDVIQGLNDTIRHELTHMVQYVYLGDYKEQIDDSGDYNNQEIEFDPRLKNIIGEKVISDMKRNPYKFYDKYDFQLLMNSVNNHHVVKDWKENDIERYKRAMTKIVPTVYKLIQIHNKKVIDHDNEEWGMTDYELMSFKEKLQYIRDNKKSK